MPQCEVSAGDGHVPLHVRARHDRCGQVRAHTAEAV